MSSWPGQRLSFSEKNTHLLPELAHNDVTENLPTDLRDFFEGSEREQMQANLAKIARCRRDVNFAARFIVLR